MGLEHASRSELVAALPPPEAFPLVTDLGKLGLARFREKHAIPTPLLYEHGPVDSAALFDDLKQFFAPDYQWEAPFFDEHHLHWHAEWYRPKYWNGDTIPGLFRNLPIHKWWSARQYHQFTHVMSLEPGVPDMEVMRRDVDKHRHHAHMHSLVSSVLDLARAQERAIYRPSEKLFIDIKGRRSFTQDRLESSREFLIRVLEENFMNGHLPDLSQPHVLALVDNEPLLEVLPKIRNQLGEVAVLSDGRRRKGRAISVPVRRVA